MKINQLENNEKFEKKCKKHNFFLHFIGAIGIIGYSGNIY